MDRNEIERIKAMTPRQISSKISLMMRNAFENVDDREVLEFFTSIDRMDLNVSESAYLKYLNQIKLLLIKEDDPTSYINGISALKKIYSSLGVLFPKQALINRFCLCVYKAENQSHTGYKLWMKDALNHKVFAKATYEKVISQKYMNDLVRKYNNEISKKEKECIND
ncbi:MAG: hypothetical protein KBT30_02895 [Clostridiales bacterium]|nr:hypothetical protein [Candidatus Apopatousia equi]